MSIEYDERLQRPMRKLPINPDAEKAQKEVDELHAWVMRYDPSAEFTMKDYEAANQTWLFKPNSRVLSRWGKSFHRHLRTVSRKNKGMKLAEKVLAALKKVQLEYVLEEIQILRAKSELS